MFCAKVVEVAGNLVELLADDVRRHDRLVAAFAQTLADEIFDDAADDRALGMPEDQAGAGVLFDRIEVELGAEFTVVALERFFDLGEVRVELGAVVPGGAVDALQHRAVLVAAPVGTGDARELQRADLAGGIGMTAAA